MKFWFHRMKKLEIWEQVFETFHSLFENFFIKTVFLFFFLSNKFFGWENSFLFFFSKFKNNKVLFKANYQTSKYLEPGGWDFQIFWKEWRTFKSKYAFRIFRLHSKKRKGLPYNHEKKLTKFLQLLLGRLVMESKKN